MSESEIFDGSVGGSLDGEKTGPTWNASWDDVSDEVVLSVPKSLGQLRWSSKIARVAFSLWLGGNAMEARLLCMGRFDKPFFASWLCFVGSVWARQSSY